VELGLAPGAPVVPDRGSLAAFRDSFAAIEAWCSDPQRILSELPGLVSRLPALGDVVIDGSPVFAMLDQTPDRLETVLAAATGVASRNPQRAGKGKPGDLDAVALDLRVRRRLRSLLETRQAYQIRMRSLVLVVRSKDQSFERVLAPSSSAPFVPRSPLLKDLVDQEDAVLRAQNDLVALWAAFHAGRLALYRDLGVLLCDNWESFLELLSARPAGDAPAPSLPPPPANARPAP
jgi:hypothetical protein